MNSFHHHLSWRTFFNYWTVVFVTICDFCTCPHVYVRVLRVKLQPTILLLHGKAVYYLTTTFLDKIWTPPNQAK